VMAWTTGFPFGVNFGKGYPRFNPGEFTIVDLLSRGEADLLLSIASDPIASLPKTARKRIEEIPLIAIDTHDSETTRRAQVAFITATAGIGAEGTVYRMDNVPLHMGKLLELPFPSDEDLLSQLHIRVKELKS
jgi:formylmethanofuran dehydrogenase subunit B